MYVDVPWRDEVIDHPLNIQNGHLILSDRPGLGVDLVEEAMEAHPGVTKEEEGFYI